MKKIVTVLTVIAFLFGSAFVIGSFKTNRIIVPAKEINWTKLPAEATNWTCDPAHSNVKFSVMHLGVSEMEGKFKVFDGKMSYAKEDMSDAQVEFSVDVNSIDTDYDVRDNHLKSDDFFNAEKFPKMIFKSSSFEHVGDNKYKLTGNMTIRDVTQPVTYDVTYGGTKPDGYGNTKAGFVATTTINRLDYKINWNVVSEGTSVVSTDVIIKINLELKKI